MRVLRIVDTVRRGRVGRARYRAMGVGFELMLAVAATMVRVAVDRHPAVMRGMADGLAIVGAVAPGPVSIRSQVVMGIARRMRKRGILVGIDVVRRTAGRRRVLVLARARYRTISIGLRVVLAEVAGFTLRPRRRRRPRPRSELIWCANIQNGCVSGLSRKADYPTGFRQ